MRGQRSHNCAAGPSNMGNFAATGDAQRAGNAPDRAKKFHGENFDAKLKTENFPTNLSPHEPPPPPCTVRQKAPASADAMRCQAASRCSQCTRACALSHRDCGGCRTMKLIHRRARETSHGVFFKKRGCPAACLRARTLACLPTVGHRLRAHAHPNRRPPPERTGTRPKRLGPPVRARVPTVGPPPPAALNRLPTVHDRGPAQTHVKLVPRCTAARGYCCRGQEYARAPPSPPVSQGGTAA